MSPHAHMVQPIAKAIDEADLLILESPPAIVTE